MKNSKKAEQTKQLKHMSFEIPKFIPYLIFLIFTIIYFFPQLIGNSFFWEDFTEYVYPVQTFAARETIEEGIPFWNPYTFAGMPFLADLQVGYFYPLNRILSLFVDSNGYLSVWWLQLLIIIHFFIAQLSIYKLMRYLGTSIGGSIISAVTYSFSLIITSHVFHPMMIYHLAWFPLAFMFIKKALDSNSIKSASLGGIILGFSFLAGHPQTLLYEMFFLGIFIIFHFISSIKDKLFEENSLAKYIGAVVLFFTVSIGIFMIQYLPSSELANLSNRAEMTYEESAEGSLEFKQILTAFVPKLFGEVNGNNDSKIQYHLTDGSQPKPYFNYWETGFYFGIIPIFLSFFAFNFNKNSFLKIFLITIAGLSFLYALGDNFFVHEIINSLPLFGQFRNPARILFYLVLLFSIFSGFGFDQLLQRPKLRLKNLLINALLPSIFLILALVGMLQTFVGSPEQFISEIGNTALIPLIFLILAILSLNYLIKRKKYADLVAIGLALLILFDLNIAGASLNQSNQNPKEAYLLDSQLKSAIKPKKAYEYRVNMRLYEPIPFMAMKRNQGMIDEIPLVEGYNPLVLQQVFPPVADSETAFDLMNVKYYIELDQGARRPVFAENQDIMPRLWTVHSYAIMNPADLEPRLKKGNFDFSNDVAITEKVDLKFTYKHDLESKEEILEYKNNYIKAKVNTSENAFLVFSEVYYPAWKAYVNGIEQQLYKVNGNLRGVVVERGESIVELKYESDSFQYGFYLSLISLLIAAGSIIIYKKDK